MKKLLSFFKFSIAVLSLTLLGNANILAQDFSSMHYNSVMTKVIHRQQMKAIYGKDLYRKSDANKRQAPSQAPAPTVPAPQAAQQTSLSYEPDPALTQSGLNAFIERAKKNTQDPKYAQQIEQLYTRHDAKALYRQIAQQYGLELNNPAHSLAAYNVLVWLIAHGITDDADSQAVRAVVDKTEKMLLATPAMATASKRQMLDEEMMYTFVAVHAGWQSSHREGKDSFRQYGDTINQMWINQFGQDLRQLALTQHGFVRR